MLRLSAWARNGLTDEQIARNMGITAKTLYEWKKKYGKISEALKKNKEVVDIEVENVLLKKALSGDITAIIYWLKNRKPKDWRDKPTTDNSDIINKLDEVIGGIDAISHK